MMTSMEMSTRAATFKEMSRVLTMETVRETDERAFEVDVPHATTSRFKRLQFMGRWRKLNPLRCWWLQLLAIVCAATMVVVVGVVVYRNSLANKRQEIRLKCDNRKEVRPLQAPPFTLFDPLACSSILYLWIVLTAPILM